MMNERYDRNIGAITKEEQELLETRKAAIVGCGGLGCYAAEFLARIGLGHLTLIDGDVFTQPNLNRQLNSLETNIGMGKASETKKKLLQIRTGLSVSAFDLFLDDKNAGELLKGHDIIIDALDSVKTRLLVEKTANELGIPLVHGAVEEWGAQVCTVFPGDFTLSTLYSAGREFERPSVVSFTPAFCASIQASEAVKVLLNKENILRKKLLTADLRENSYEIVQL
ncbi:MAG: HesA/MoeB/ThiF family protein [Treponema sp.]|jgi:molybdopterin/thiamine biosynthesis adenylyltransferase|nr:HesA/MoeB/ThiF family protein [Treponema sp.]